MHLTRRSMMCALPALGLAGTAWGQRSQTPTGSHIAAPLPLETYADGTQLDAWVDMYGRPTAKVMVNGKGPLQFMVDTGSTTTVVAARHVEMLGITIAGQATVAGTTGEALMPTATVARVQSGAVTKDDIRVAVLPDALLGQADGILGADVFIGRRLVFNIRDKQVRVESSRRRGTGPGNMKVRNGLLAEIDGRVGNVPAKLMLDTGAQNCIANPLLNEALRIQHPRLERLENVRVYGVTGQQLMGEFVSLPRVDLRAFTVKDAGCVAADAPIFDLWGLSDQPAMIVGVNLLSRLNSFSIDYGARLFDAELAYDGSRRVVPIG